MRTDTVLVSDQHMDAALEEAEKVAVYKELSPKGELHLRLLTEEMMGLVRSVAGSNGGKFWIEDRNGIFELHLLTLSPMSGLKRKQLLSAATSGKNESAKSFMGRLKEFFYRSDAGSPTFTSELMYAGMMSAQEGSMYMSGVDLTDSFSSHYYISHDAEAHAMDYDWSLNHYREVLSDDQLSADRKDAWDELEKSVLAKVADEVRIGILGDQVEMVVYKKIS